MYKYTSNSKLKTLETPFKWLGTPIDNKGRIVNEEVPFINSFRKLLKWQTMRNPQKFEKKHERWHLPIDDRGDFLTTKEDCIVWLGHSSFFIRISNITILIDPVFFNVSFLKRKLEFPVSPYLFKEIDYILISHDHRDHCDEKSLKILANNNPTATYLTGLGMVPLLKQFTGSNKIQAAGWYQKYDIISELQICFTPSKHWGRRHLNDMNCRLWGGFVIQNGDKTIYFSGDSGYGKHFSELAEIFPAIDYAIIGIGAYKPLFFMSQIHLSPAEAIQAFKDLKAKEMIPMHHGTFDLSDEPLSDPIKTLQKHETIEGIKGQVDYLNPGETFVIS
jgi:L-ascorbate metabolism protein UlaG (beta-lactamase superfamily)